MVLLGASTVISSSVSTLASGSNNTFIMRGPPSIFTTTIILNKSSGVSASQRVGERPSFTESAKVRMSLSSRQDSGLKSGRDNRPQARAVGGDNGSPDLERVNATGSFPRMRYELPRK